MDMDKLYDGKDTVVPGFLRGYRCWRYDRYTLELYPIHVDLGPWSGGHLRAACYDPRHHEEAPVAYCRCGIYATYNPKDYRSQQPSFWHINDGTFVHGSIKATGRVILGEIGFRAEEAKVEAVWGLRARAIASLYEVPWFLTQGRLLKHFPPHNMETLLEENPDGRPVQQHE